MATQLFMFQELEADTYIKALSHLTKSHESTRKKLFAEIDDLRNEVELLSTNLQLIIESIDNHFQSK